MKTIQRRRGDAFSRIDLIAVGGTIMALTLLTLKTLAVGQIQNHAVICVSNLRRLGQAWLMYAEDNDGRLVGNLNGGGTTSLSNSNQTWVLGMLDLTGGTAFPSAFGGNANTNTLVLSQLSPLAPFANHDSTLFRCPADPGSDPGSRARGGGPRVRSLSMNAYQGGQGWDAGYQTFNRLSDFVSLPPSRSFMLIEEHESSINDGYFIVSMQGYPDNPNATTFVDLPAAFHNGGVCLNFADGHAELKRWTDPRTVNSPKFGATFNNSADVIWLQDRTTRKVTTK